MKVNGYEVGNEPTSEEFGIYFDVRDHYERHWIAEWLEYEEPLSQGEFDRLVWAFQDADFSAEETDFLRYEYERILSERSRGCAR